MMMIPRSSRWVAVTALLLAVAAGALVGYLLGRAEVLRAAGDGLAADAETLVRTLTSMVVESKDLLAKMDASPFAHCSDEDIAWFRRQLYHSPDLKDAGRIRDGRIQCTAVYGREELPGGQIQPSSVNLEGTTIYIDLPLYAIPGVPVYARQRGDAFAVEDTNFSVRFNRHRANHGFASLAVPRQPNGYPAGFYPKAPGVIADRDAQGQLGDTLYATRCSKRSLECVVSYGSAGASLQQAVGTLIIHSALGGLSWGSLVLIFLLLYQRSRSMGAQLRRAIREGKLRLVYQPIVELSSGRTVQAEALLRWTDEDGYTISPPIFVFVAEDQGFVGELTEFVVRQALREMGDLLREGDFQVSVNVTASDMEDAGFLPMLERCLSEAGVMPQRLGIELTESSTANTRAAIATIRQLRQRGHCVKIDDFGTGYSSLAYLNN